MRDVKKLTSMEDIKVVTDPFRMIIMQNFFKLERPATVKQISECMGEVPAKVHYHVKKLVNAGILELNYTKEVNGILAKYYEPTAKYFQVNNDELKYFGDSMISLHDDKYIYEGVQDYNFRLNDKEYKELMDVINNFSKTLSKETNKKFSVSISLNEIE